MSEIAPPIRETIRGMVNAVSMWPLLLTSPPGSGKTCAALCLADHCPGAWYLTVPGFCYQMNRAAIRGLDWSHEGRGGTWFPHHIWEMIAKAPLVILDEIGVRGNVSDSHYETVKEMLDVRHYKPLVCISNKTLAELGHLYDGRVMSRLGAGTILEAGGEDRRLQ